MDIAAKIEQNRRALLRIVAFWLFAALCAKRVKQVLPLGVDEWFGQLAFKLEASTGYLVQAWRRIHGLAIDENCPFFKTAEPHRLGLAFDPQSRLSLEEIIVRLRAIRAALRRLKTVLKSAYPKARQIHFRGNASIVNCKIACLERPKLIPP